MSNIWTKFIHKKNTDDINKDNSFLDELERFIGNITNHNHNIKKEDDLSELEKDDNYSEVGYSQEPNGDIEIIKWSSKSHYGHDIQDETYPDDVVKLVKTQDVCLYLKYSIVSEEVDDVPVESVEEAVSIIEEDNNTTEDMYPDNPELKWTKIKDIRHQHEDVMVKNKKNNKLYIN
ncbi:hypothetical protein [Methanohalobium sp.]|uniref:hypothetical protein n=1 Tax=Methanohalobium sp. TaxID=2837493 RepID=UPI0025FB1214|nr:hypothetical protein [Methanohalobium sp.]